MFQFLSRNSVRWDVIVTAIAAWSVDVSIPQSEFCPLGPGDDYLSALSVANVSIPQSEFCPLGQEDARFILPIATQFQFLSRNSVRWDESEFDFIEDLGVFQFLSRNSVRWDH